MGALILISVVLFLGTAFFVAAEYSLLSVRRSLIKSEADRGRGNAKAILHALDRKHRYVAGTQFGITMLGIAIGSVTEPPITEGLKENLSFLPAGVVTVVSILLISFPLVVLGELVPKYLAIKHPDKVAGAVIRPLSLYVLIASPFIWLFDKSGQGVLRLMKVRIDEHMDDSVSREELALLLQSGETQGQFEEEHADVILKALRLDELMAKDVMVHRLDMQCLPVDADREDLSRRIQDISHARIPIFQGDLDTITGIVYIQDLIKVWDHPEFTLAQCIKPATFVPENLTLDRALTTMRERRSQILIIQDEYGGTSGLLTLEDLVEELFGDLQDRLESEQAPIIWASPARLTLNPKVRWDELLEFLDLSINPDSSRASVSQMVFDELQRVPRQGDAIETDLGKLVVLQTTRRKIMLLALHLNETAKALVTPPVENP
jgi:CBS domain containing-hemolysin-like protein